MLTRTRIRLSIFLALLGMAMCLPAQSTSISGTINTVQAAVTAINTVANTVTLTSAAGFNVGDTVLVIQMKGATINTSNAATFGDIAAINAAGKYELNIVCGITGNDITLERNLLNAYNATGRVQVIRVPHYDNAVVSGTLTAPNWNGTTGGVLVFAASGWVRLDADINVNGAGFANGWDHSNYAGQGCDCNCGGGQFADFFYPVFNCRAADKGEGITDSITTMAFGKGKEATGGGGGNDHNGGGGGGSNYGAGGNGGNSNAPTCFFGAYCRGLNPGVGGLSLNTAGFISAAQNRIFLGGGGGAGHDNNNTGTAGARGGGIVIICADSINLNGRTIFARGNSQTILSTSDGAGGGGAGGTVVIDARIVRPSTGTINVSGGNGGSDSWTTNTQGCKGPGGGGGGGAIWTRLTLPGTVTTIVGGGTNGTNCSGANSAQPGGAGGVITSLVLPINSSTFPPCVLPVEFAYFSAAPQGNDQVLLAWGTASEQRNHLFAIEHSIDGTAFITIGSLPSISEFGEGRDYTFTHQHPTQGTNWYRLRQVDINGTATYSEVRMAVVGMDATVVGLVYPNPSRPQELLSVDIFAALRGEATLSIYDLSGRQHQSGQATLDAGPNTLNLPTQALAAGTYILQVRLHGQSPVFRRFTIAD